MPRKVIKGYNDLETVNPELAAQWHPTKNGSLLPTDCSFSSTRKVWWICKNGHEWEATVYNRYHGSGCPYCAGKKVLPGLNDIATTHPNLALEWHPTKNAPLTPAEVSIGSVKRVWWICRQGHEWQASPNTRSKTGCPYCSGKAVLPGYNDLATTDPTLAEEWHPTKNGELTPSMVTRGSVKKVWWLGKCGHEWQATINNRRYDHGCPVCNLRNKSSFPEQSIYFYVKKLFPDAVNGYKEGLPRNMELDIFIPSISIGVEYDGIAWHNSPEAKQREARKYAYCKSSNIKLYRIIETSSPIDIDNCDEIITIPPIPSYSDLDRVIERLLSFLNPEVKGFNVDVAKSEAEIKGNYLASLSDSSLSAVNPLLAAEWHPMKNGSLLPSMFRPSAHDKVWWLGKCGHEWQADISSRNAGRGCPYCSNNKLLQGFNDLETINPNLAKEWHPKKNGELTGRNVIANSHKSVWWLGKCGHEWQATVYSRNSGSGCPYCTGYKVLHGFNDLATNNPELAKEWHPTKNGDKKPNMFTCSSGEKVWWICNYGHEWETTISNRSKGHGCPICSRIKRGVNDLLTVAPELAKEWHPVKNGALTPQDVGLHSDKKVWWLGKCGHEWQTSVSNRSKGHGCPYCFSNRLMKGYNDLETTHPELAKEWHPTKNEDKVPSMFTSNSEESVWWKCKFGHEWKTSIRVRSRGHGCPVCSRVKRGINDLATTNPELAEEWHPTKNGSLRPVDVSKGSKMKVWWLGKCGHEWQSTVNNRSKGTGCPYCANTRKDTRLTKQDK